MNAVGWIQLSYTFKKPSLTNYATIKEPILTLFLLFFGPLHSLSLLVGVRPVNACKYVGYTLRA